MKVQAGALALAIRLQEASDALSANDTANRLRDCIADCYRGTGQWAYYIDHIGDGESGDVIYSCDGDTFKAPYEISGSTGAAKCTIDTESAVDVVPRTMWEEEADEADHMAAMESARTDKLYSEVPVYERFVSKSEREDAPSGSFAGKGKSFPILKPQDVKAAASSLGRAGSGNYSTDTIKRNIIRIAKSKGWTKYLPKAWQDGGGDSDSKESALGAQSSSLRLVESAATIEPIVLREARADYEIKLIAPGKGSSAVYPAEVLKRDGPQVFKAGTHIYLNHPTAAEEAARPEGDVNNLAGVLSTDAAYQESHPKGPGLYARMKVFADHAQTVEEKAPHVGMSIRANGVAEAQRDSSGLPVLKALTAATSVDVVTRAGAGGMILTEAARPSSNSTEGDDMDAAENTKLLERLAAQEATNKRLLERAIKGDARELAARILKPLTMHEAFKGEVIENCLRDVPTKDGGLDETKFTEAVNAEAKRLGALAAQVTGSGRVTGMGATVIPQQTPEQIQATEAQRKREEDEEIAVFESLMGGNKQAAIAAARGRAA